MAPLIAPVSRTTIFVRDMSRALAFYRDLLGLTVQLDTAIPKPGASQILVQYCRALRIVILRAADTPIGNISFAEVQGAEPPLPDRPLPGRVTLGEACLVIRNTSEGIATAPARLSRRDDH